MKNKTTPIVFGSENTDTKLVRLQARIKYARLMQSADPASVSLRNIIRKGNVLERDVFLELVDICNTDESHIYFATFDDFNHPDNHGFGTVTDRINGLKRS